MATTETYQGYANYETFAIKLWLDNDREEYDYWRDVATEPVGNDESGFSRTQEGALADALKEHFENMWEENVVLYFVSPAGLYRDLMSHALARVNWLEIARELIEEQGE